MAPTAARQRNAVSESMALGLVLNGENSIPFDLITGEAGIGKTRLLREAREAAEQRGLLVLSERR